MIIAPRNNCGVFLVHTDLDEAMMQDTWTKEGGGGGGGGDKYVISMNHDASNA